jgi:peptide/nickel transport system substrate-binding protein
MSALNQPAFLQTQVGNPEMYRICFSIYPCNTLYATVTGMDFIAKPDIHRARRLLKDAGYDGAPVVLLQQTDLTSEAKLPTVAKQLLTEAGFNVDMQSMDWGTLQSRRAKKDGWSIFLTSSSLVARLSPASFAQLSGACDEAWFGWPCDPELERLRDAFALADDEKERKALAERIQVRAMEIGTHVPLGEYVTATAARKTVRGFVTGYFLVLWNVEKQ